jgi:hypothetical protein
MQTLLYPTGVPLWPVCRAAVGHALHRASSVGAGSGMARILCVQSLQQQAQHSQCCRQGSSCADSAAERPVATHYGCCQWLSISGSCCTIIQLLFQPLEACPLNWPHPCLSS